MEYSHVTYFTVFYTVINKHNKNDRVYKSGGDTLWCRWLRH